MEKYKLIALVTLLLFGNMCMGQGASDIEASRLYLLGLQYKNANGVEMDYSKAYDYFRQSASMGNDQAVYALAYMSYKGLGCPQDYGAAARLFSLGANKERDNSMYFYGLCWRNGYGVQRNRDSATYWLEKSAAVGYPQAIEELKTPLAENVSDSLSKLVERLGDNAALPFLRIPNTFVRLEQTVPDRNMLDGRFTGSFVQYDWSGRYVVAYRKLSIMLDGRQDPVRGKWVEEGEDSTEFSAFFRGDSLSFASGSYRRRDHYSLDSAIGYDLSSAHLRFVRRGDTVYLAGNIKMFSEGRGEPSKPILLAVSRISGTTPQVQGALKVYPNPFKESLTVVFSLASSANVGIELVGMDGVTYYSKGVQRLSAGSYQFLLQPPHLSPGVYFVRIREDGKSRSAKVMKLQ